TTVRDFVGCAVRYLRRRPCMDTGAHRIDLDHCVCSARAAPCRAPTDRPAALRESGGDVRQLGDVPVLRWFFRRRIVVAQLFPAVAASDAAAVRGAHGPAGTRRDAGY